MKLKGIVILFLFVSAFENVSSVEDKTDNKYVSHGRLTVRTMLADRLQEELPKEIQDCADQKAQIYADMFSYDRAFSKSASGDQVVEADGLVGVLFKAVHKAKDIEEYKQQISRRKTEILEMVQKKKNDGKILMGIGVGYICEDVVENILIRGIANKFTMDGNRIVHLNVTLTFSMETSQNGLQEIEAVFGKTGQPQVTSSLEYNHIASLWATSYYVTLDTNYKPRSDKKDVWITPYGPCSLQSAVGKIETFITTVLANFKSEFFVSAVWIQPKQYTYDVNHDSLTNIRQEDEDGVLVIATKFPQDFEPAEEEELFKTIRKKKHSSATRCEVAKEITQLRWKRIEKMDNGLKFSVECDPSMEKPSFARIVSFRVRTGIPQALNAPYYSRSFIPKEFFEILHKIRGYAFRRIMERDTETNEIKSLTLMAVIVDEEILELKLSDVRLNAWAIEGVVDYAINQTDLQLSGNAKEPFRENFQGNRGFIRDTTRENERIARAKRIADQFLKDNQEGSVAVAIYVHDARYYDRNNLYTWWGFSIAVIFVPEDFKVSAKYLVKKENLNVFEDPTNIAATNITHADNLNTTPPYKV